MLVAGVELGGTKCVCVLGSGPGDVRAEVRLETTDPARTLARIADTVAGWHAVSRLAAIGIASFGPLDLDLASPAYGRVLATPKPGWSGADVVSPLRKLGLPIAVDTDVNAAALAEGRWGAARGLDHYVYVTVGTGIGVGTIVHGRPVRGAGHSEAGHLRVGRAAGDEFPGVCPFHGDCVEGLASGPAIAARAGRPAESLDGDDPAWPMAAHALGGLLHNLTLTVAPSRILLGGGVTSGQPQLLPLVRRALLESLRGYAHVAAIGEDASQFLVAPALGQRAGSMGAIALALDGT